MAEWRQRERLQVKLDERCAALALGLCVIGAGIVTILLRVFVIGLH